MALQADEPDFLPYQQAGIVRAMGLMAGGTGLEADRGMLKRKRTSFVAMAAVTTRLIGGEGLSHRAAGSSVRIMAIHARHGVFFK